MTANEEFGDWIAEYSKYLEKISWCKNKMVKQGLTRATANCPKCGVKDALQVALAPSRRGSHGYAARWVCTNDQCRFAGLE